MLIEGQSLICEIIQTAHQVYALLLGCLGSMMEDTGIKWFRCGEECL